MAVKLVPLLLWPAIVCLPLILTYNNYYEDVFPSQWYVTAPTDYWFESKGVWPSPVGLSLGIIAVVIGQIFTLIYFSLWNGGMFGELYPIEKKGPPVYDYWTAMIHHLKQPEGFVMLGAYLVLTWMFGLMPASYYSFVGGINWMQVLLQLLITDFLQYVAHRLEHDVSKWFYRVTHKPHHKYTNPKLFDAFDGSPGDTFCMILVPLALTARLVNANVWTYMTFGTLYANWLCLIHSEYRHPWDRLFRAYGLGTSADHHVHHNLFKYNFGHLFM
jgi:sterol desaturase/sphingolipid hydroxylase (fatty acid hydroxylase superfamily)